jgi:sec-independent protein translocase protein TatA
MTTLHFASGLFGTPEMLIVAVLALVLVGARKLPTFLRSLGESMDFRKVRDEFEERLSRMQNDLYWNQYDAGDKTNVTERWKRLPAPERPNFWGRRRSWRLGLGRVLQASQH